MWNQIAGSNCTSASGLPLWYPGYSSGIADCTDFTPFGGWTHAYAHQYADHSSGLAPDCTGINADVNVKC